MREVRGAERASILADLKAAKAELYRAFDKDCIVHPDVGRSVKSKQERAKLEAKMKKVEITIDKFSSPDAVFLPIDS